jgi:P-type conjugative transfer protein TrbG
MKIPILLSALAAAAPLSAQSAAPAALGVPASRALPAGVAEARFGLEVPVLGCDQLRACRVELEAGERLLSPPALGDAERWLTAQLSSGSGGAVTVVVVKPTACGIATNLIIATDRRIYDLDLQSGACRGATPSTARAIRFSYPEEPEPAYVTALEMSTLAERAARAPYTGYRWRRRGGFPWEPARVADDGAHVYLELPPAARFRPAPVLYSLDSGERTLMNYATEDSLFVTDRLFSRATLVVGDASLEIERRTQRGRLSLGRKGAAALAAAGGLAIGFWIGR